LITPQNPSINSYQGPNLKDFMASCKYGRADLRLAEQIYNNINKFNGFDLGTKCKLAAICGLVRGNLQFPGIVSLFSQPKIS